MSRQQQTRSSLEIGAVAQAAAGGLPKGLPPIVKPRIIAALAGFVLRMFRDRMTAGQPASVRPRGRSHPGSIRVPSRFQNGTASAGRDGPTGPDTDNPRRGGTRHG